MSNVLSGLRFVFGGTSTCNYLARQLDPLRIQLLNLARPSWQPPTDRMVLKLQRIPRASSTDKGQKVDKRLPQKKTTVSCKQMVAAKEISVDAASGSFSIAGRHFRIKRSNVKTTLKAFLGGQHCFALLWARSVAVSRRPVTRH